MDSRIDQHVVKGKEDGLYISCVASSSNLWAIIMDAGTGFTSQVYELSPIFLHKVRLFRFFLFKLSTLLFINLGMHFLSKLALSECFIRSG